MPRILSRAKLLGLMVRFWIGRLDQNYAGLAQAPSVPAGKLEGLSTQAIA